MSERTPLVISTSEQPPLARFAVDARSGMSVLGTVNETAKRAKAKGFPTGCVAARPDIEAAVDYAAPGNEGYWRAFTAFFRTRSGAVNLGAVASHAALMEGDPSCNARRSRDLWRA